MRARLALGAAGGGIGAAVLVVILAASPWRPTGLFVGAVTGLVAVPGATGAGVAAALRIGGQSGVVDAARVAAVGAPVWLLLWLFALLAAGVEGGAVQQSAAAVLAGAGSGWLAVRFAGVEPGPLE